jgi:SagB-type dehydrogenase family enzyme
MNTETDRMALDLYHLQSSNTREVLPDLSVNDDHRPFKWRTYPEAPRIDLPGKEFDLKVPFDQVIASRRSIRDYHLQDLPLDSLGSLLFCSYGVNGLKNVDCEWVYLRPSPSAGGLAPLEIYIATQRVSDLADGIYHYDPRAHQLEFLADGVFHSQLADMTLGQDMLKTANLGIIITAIFERTLWKYGPRGYRYVWLDAGHLGQNIYLVATALGLGPVAIGGFFDSEISQMLTLPEEEAPIYLFSIGQNGGTQA